MTKSILSILALLSLSACASVEMNDANDPNEPKVAVERRYTTGSMIPQKKAVRDNNGVKTVEGDDLINMPRATTPNDPLGKR